MSIDQLLLAIVIIVFVASAYSAQSKRNKVLCHFTGQDKTEEDKWVKMKPGGTVDFRGMRFDIVPDRITSFWLTKGFHYLFPTRVNYCKFSWYSRWPHDPNDYNVTSMNPAVRKAFNKNEWVTSFTRSSSPTAAKKQSMLAAYLPIITLAVMVIAGFYFYTELEGMKSFMAQLQNSFNTLAK